METTKPAKGVCISCGQPAIVTVVGESGGGRPTRREYCLDCAGRRQESAAVVGTVVGPLLPSLLIKGGAILGLLSLVADYLHIAGKSGFGWKQIAGTEIGALALTLGAFLRMGFLTVGGLVLVVISLGADYLGIGHSEGLGWAQLIALPISVACVVAGLLWQRHNSVRKLP